MTTQIGDGSIVRLALKGGSVLLYGNSQNGIQWSNLTGEFLFNVIVNRSNLDNPLICIYAGAPPSQYIHDSITYAKKNYIHIVDASNPDVSFSDINHQLISILINDLASTYKSYSIMIFGYSDLIIRNDLNKSIAFIKDCLSYKKSLPNMNTGKDSIIDKEESLGKVFAVVQANLHSKYTIEILKQNFTSIISAGPSALSLSGVSKNLSLNDNRLAIADINIIRKSPNTGKILEEEEIFGFDNVSHRLYPLSISKDNSRVEDVKAKNVQSSLLELQLGGAANTIQTNNKTTRHELKISYNSTDPEWDDDPNPDDDLDL